jgi:N utilization substance protein B
MQLAFERALGGDGGEYSISAAYEQLGKKPGYEPPQTDKDYIRYTMDGISSHLYDIDTMIEKNSIGWSLNRMAKVDLTILRLALFEMLYNDNVPDNVAISEAVELANRYSDPAGSRFINGILGAVQRKL